MINVELLAESCSNNLNRALLIIENIKYIIMKK